MRKKLFATVIIAGSLLALSACAKQPEEAVVPTATTAPTVTMAVQETLAPTPEVAATEAPTETPVTATPEPTSTPTQVVEPTVEPTAEPTATAAPTITPTEVPHEHTWTEKETAPTCTADGLYWEECDCGEIQNETRIPSTGHAETTYQIVADPTVEEAGKYETTCNICQMVIESGAIPKLTPTVTPTPTAEPTVAPTATATSTPVPTEEPTAAPTETPVPTATAAPKPTKAPTATPSPKPTKKPEPTATPGPTRIPVEEYTWWDVNHELIRYADESCTEVIKTYYDLNLVSERLTLYNYSDLKGEPIDVLIKNYPSEDAKTLDTIPTYLIENLIRGQVKVIDRCLETGWYRVCYGKDKNGNDLIGYVDDEYVKAEAKSGISNEGYHVPAYEYCQFELPYLEPVHKLNPPEDLVLSVGESEWFSITPKSVTMYYQLYYPNLRKEKGTAQTVGVFTIDNPDVAEIKSSGYYQAEIGHYDTNGAYAATFIAKSAGITTVTLMEYEISDYQHNDGEPTFTLGNVINTVTFNITVTE